MFNKNIFAPGKKLGRTKGRPETMFGSIPLFISENTISDSSYTCGVATTNGKIIGFTPQGKERTSHLGEKFPIRNFRCIPAQESISRSQSFIFAWIEIASPDRKKDKLKLCMPLCRNRSDQ